MFSLVHFVNFGMYVNRAPSRILLVEEEKKEKKEKEGQRGMGVLTIPLSGHYREQSIGEQEDCMESIVQYQECCVASCSIGGRDLQ